MTYTAVIHQKTFKMFGLAVHSILSLKSVMIKAAKLPVDMEITKARLFLLPYIHFIPYINYREPYRILSTSMSCPGPQ